MSKCKTNSKQKATTTAQIKTKAKLQKCANNFLTPAFMLEFYEEMKCKESNPLQPMMLATL